MKKIILLFLFLFSPTYAAEQINHFDTHVFVNKNASIDVIENITVHAEDIKIKHGLVRRLPTNYIDSYGISRHTEYQIQKILLDLSPSPYHVEYDNNQLAIYIGDKNIFLRPNDYMYSISYHVNDAVNFLRDNDEVYWNMTGNNWDFPILKATATIYLPDGAVISSAAAYTGFTGMKGQDYVISYPEKNKLTVVTTKTLASGEGLTVAAAWQKGIVIQRTWLEKISVNDYVIFASTIFLFLYYYIVWYGHGRDLRNKSIIPLFEPPEHLTPEALRYIIRMGYDKKTFAAAIVNMATAGYLTIKYDYAAFTLKKNKNTNVTLPEEEEQIAKNLFGSKDSIQLEQSNHDQLQDAEKDFKSRLSEKYKNKYFVTNTKYLLFGLVPTLIAFAAAILGSYDDKTALFLMIWLSIWTVGCYYLLNQAFVNIQQAKAYKSMVTIGKALFSSLFALPFLLGEAVALFAATELMSIFSIPCIFSIILLNIIFYFLLKAPTSEGRILMDQIDGFRLFLKTTERFRLQQFNPPEKTPEMFEKFLPYAIALDVENEWGAQFESILRNAGMEPARYHPTWYSGSSWTSNSMVALPAMLGMGIGSALASVTSPSSGAGGGGSSGGGGGGGGGGGW